MMYSGSDGATEELFRPEIENRIRNLFWTVSGDYSLNLKPDVDTFLRSKQVAIYDAVKQGAFAKYFNANELALYTLKKRAKGADEDLLYRLTQMCVDAAAYPIAGRERSGVPEIRRNAFQDMLAEGLPSDVLGQVQECIICDFLGEEERFTPEIRDIAGEIAALSGEQDTSRLIAVVDGLYNRVLDPGFAARQGDLQTVLGVTMEELLEYHRALAVSDETMERVLEEYLSALKDELMRTRPKIRQRAWKMTVPEETEEAEESQPSSEEAEKVYAFMERQFGKSYLTRSEQQRLNRKFCTGTHSRCSLFFTDGILSNPAVKNTQFLRTQMQSMKNEMYFAMKQQPIRRSVAVLSAMLKQVLVQRMDEDSIRADNGTINTARLWKVGRTRDAKLFDTRKKRLSGEFVVDILLDSSSSQTPRQPQIAAQAYIISQALSHAGIPHRVTSFCSYWDYTMLHRFRDYNDGPEANKNILQFRAFGENRDGLAIKAVCDGLAQRAEENRILIILSDGRPNNLGVSRPGSRKPAVYVGEDALRDTAFEVRKARNRGIAVMGVFVGSEEDLAAEKKIFGKEFAYTRNISSFAHIVGSYLRKQLET